MCYDSFIAPPDAEAKQNYKVNLWELTYYEVVACFAFVLNLVYGSMIAYDLNHNY